jgi:hypothetical protein
MITDKDGHMLLPLIMLTCNTLRYALQQWQKTKGVHPNASNSKLTAVRPDRSNYFNHNDYNGKMASSCALTGGTL